MLALSSPFTFVLLHHLGRPLGAWVWDNVRREADVCARDSGWSRSVSIDPGPTSPWRPSPGSWPRGLWPFWWTTWSSTNICSWYLIYMSKSVQSQKFRNVSAFLQGSKKYWIGNSSFSMWYIEQKFSLSDYWMGFKLLITIIISWSLGLVLSHLGLCVFGVGLVGVGAVLGLCVPRHHLHGLHIEADAGHGHLLGLLMVNICWHNLLSSVAI